MAKVKQKTHKGLAKRLKLTKSGKVKRQRAGRGHLMSHKSGDRVRKLRKSALVAGKIATTYAYLLAPGR
jgi:large subunit ribosomal protein L35